MAYSQKNADSDFLNSKKIEMNSGNAKSQNYSRNSIVELQNVKSILRTPETTKDKKFRKNLIWKDPLVSEVKLCQNLPTVTSCEPHCAKILEKLHAAKAVLKPEDFQKKVESLVNKLHDELFILKTTVSMVKINDPSGNQNKRLMCNQLNESTNKKTVDVQSITSDPVKDSKQKISHCLSLEGPPPNEHESTLLSKGRISANSLTKKSSKPTTNKKIKDNNFASTYKIESTPIFCQGKESTRKKSLCRNLFNFQKSKLDSSVLSESDGYNISVKSENTVSPKLCAEAKIESTVSKKYYVPRVSVKRLPNEVYKECIKKGYVILKKNNAKSVPIKKESICKVNNSDIKGIVITDKSNYRNKKTLQLPSNLKEKAFELTTSTDVSNARGFTLDANLKDTLKEIVLKNVSNIESNPVRVVVPLEVVNNLQDLPSLSVIKKNVKTHPEILIISPKQKKKTTKNIEQEIKRGAVKEKIVPKKKIMNHEEKEVKKSETCPKQKKKTTKNIEQEIKRGEIKEKKVINKKIIDHEEKEFKKREMCAKKKLTIFMKENQDKVKGLNNILLSFVKNSSNLIQDLQDLNNIDKTGIMQEILDYLTEVKPKNICKKSNSIKRSPRIVKKLHQNVRKNKTREDLLNSSIYNIEPQLISTSECMDKKTSMNKFTCPVSLNEHSLNEQKRNHSATVSKDENNISKIPCDKPKNIRTTKVKKMDQNIKKKQIKNSKQVLVKPRASNIQPGLSSFKEKNIANEHLLKKQKIKLYADDPFTDMSIIADEKFLLNCRCGTPNCSEFHPELYFF